MGIGGGVSPAPNSKRTEKNLSAFVAAAAKGLSLAGCCRMVGIVDSTYRKWRVELPDFADKVDAARASNETNFAQVISDLSKEADSDSVRFNAAKFGLTHQFHWSSTQKHEVDSKVTLTPERKRELAEMSPEARKRWAAYLEQRKLDEQGGG